MPLQNAAARVARPVRAKASRPSDGSSVRGVCNRLHKLYDDASQGAADGSARSRFGRRWISQFWRARALTLRNVRGSNATEPSNTRSRRGSCVVELPPSGLSAVTPKPMIRAVRNRTAMLLSLPDKLQDPDVERGVQCCCRGGGLCSVSDVAKFDSSLCRDA